jgi:glycosyltransferase involved in cell wall biosynthesis
MSIVLPLVSVVIPAFNAERFLGEALASVRAQTYRQIEIIIVDDGSQDGTAEMIRALADESGDIPIRGFFQKNAGPACARNRGIEEARGAYTAFLDADDRWDPRKLEAQISLLESKPSVSLCTTGWRVINESGGPTHRVGGFPTGEITFETLLELNLIITPSVVGRTSLFRGLGSFNPNLRHCEDIELWLRVASSDLGKLWNLGEPLTDRRERSGQLTRDWRAMHDGWETAFELIRARAPERVRTHERAARAFNDRYCAFLAYVAGDYGAARALTWSAWRGAPIALLCSRKAYTTTIAAITSLLPGALHNYLSMTARRWREGV